MKKICIGCKEEYEVQSTNERNIYLDVGYCSICEKKEAAAETAYFQAHPCQCP